MDVIPGHLATALADRYRFLGPLGQGGMATVYLADDLKHGRRVAVKVLRPELGASIGADRFAREIAISAKLTHPHVLVLVDSGVADGTVYFVMPYLDGGSLRDRLRNRGTLALPEAIRIIEQVATALTYAHECGVVHRDVKPENILFSGDQVVLADFGIARAVEIGGGEQLTQTGMALGTPAYMSPEQAYGDADIDGRADVYALGCVLFEMLTGRPPFQGPTAQAILARHAADTVPALRAFEPTLPLYVERAVQCALAKEPASRFATPRAFADTLASQTVVAAVGRRRIAVLQPADASGAADASHLVLGLHETLISRIGEQDVAVIARTSVLPYAATPKPVRDIARELRVDAVVESVLRWGGERVRLEARVVDGVTEEAIWSGGHEGQASDPAGAFRGFADLIAGRVRDALAPSGMAARPAPPAANPVTYENYIRGRVYQERFTPNDLEAALQYYEAALRATPEFAPAHAGIALVWGSRVVMGLVPPLEGGPRWRAAASRSVAADPNLADGHQALGQAYAFHEWDWPAAEAAFERAIALNPNDPLSRTMYSHFLAAMSRPGAAALQGRRALGLDPHNPFHHTMLGLVLMFLGRYADAIEHLGRSLQMLPMNVLAQLGLAGSHLALGDQIAGLRHHANVFATFGDTQLADVLREGVATGKSREAFLRAGEILEARSRGTFVKPVHVVIMFDQGGDLDRAFEWVAKAHALRDHDMAYFAVAPWSGPFRADPRYAEMLSRMQLPAGGASGG